MSAPLSAADRAALLALARAGLLHRLGLAAPPAPAGAAGALGEPRGAFLTVLSGGETRAALGTLDPSGPLAEVAARLGARAVDGDPRERPIGPAEAPGLALRLAVLGPRRPLPPGDTPRPGLDGVAVTSGWHRGWLLPSAGDGKGWDGQAFLKHACLTAGLPARAHLEPGTVVELFEVVEFGE